MEDFNLITVFLLTEFILGVFKCIIIGVRYVVTWCEVEYRYMYVQYWHFFVWKFRKKFNLQKKNGFEYCNWYLGSLYIRFFYFPAYWFQLKVGRKSKEAFSPFLFCGCFWCWCKITKNEFREDFSWIGCFLWRRVHTLAVIIYILHAFIIIKLYFIPYSQFFMRNVDIKIYRKVLSV